MLIYAYTYVHTCIHAKKALLYNSLCKYLFEFCKLTSRLPLLEFGLSYLTSRQWDMSLSEDAFLYLVRHRFHKKNEKHLVRCFGLYDHECMKIRRRLQKQTIFKLIVFLMYLPTSHYGRHFVKT